MKKIQSLMSAAAITAVTALPVLAQQSAARVGNETALQMAQRIDACEGTSVSAAAFEQSGDVLRVSCVRGGANGIEGSLSAGSGVALGLGAVAIIAVAAGGSSSSTTTTN